MFVLISFYLITFTLFIAPLLFSGRAAYALLFLKNALFKKLLTDFYLLLLYFAFNIRKEKTSKLLKDSSWS